MQIQKKQKIGITKKLEICTNIIEIILQLVGINTFLLVASINKTWKQVYLKIFRNNPSTSVRHMMYTVHQFEWSQHPLDAKMFIIATFDNRFHILRHYILSCDSYHKEICTFASLAGHLNILKWMHKHMWVVDEEIFDIISINAAAKGRLHVLQWLKEVFHRQENQWCYDSKVYTGAAEFGHLKVLRWLKSTSRDWTQKTYIPDLCRYIALQYNHQDILSWLLTQTPNFLDKTCTAEASKWGHFTLLKWLRDKNCPWDKSTCYHAAINGHLEILKWVKQNNCPFEFDVFLVEQVTRNGHLNVLKWLKEQGYFYVYSIHINALREGHTHILDWLEEDNFY